MAPDQHEIRMKLEGENARRGVGLATFEKFVDSFLRALRDYERTRRRAQTKKSGHPEKSAAAAAAFRLVRLEPGSAIATIEPDVPELEAEGLLLDDDTPPFPIQNLLGLVDELESGELAPDVADALQDACAALGATGSISLAFPRKLRPKVSVIDRPTIERTRLPKDAEEVVTRVAGRLHRLELEPEKIGIRTAAGIDWRGSYPEDLEQRVKELVGDVVIAEGEGQRVSPLRGNMRIARIEPAEQGTQAPLFTTDQLEDSQLLEEQGIAGPQGLASVAPSKEWDELDDAYLTALLED